MPEGKYTGGNEGFRLDVNGLRAVAVIAVVLYHFRVPFIQGGYVGVDVFFVISGYLMTKIILQGVGEGSFSLARFYAARTRRILPALLSLSGVLLALGWFLLPPSDYALLGKHIQSSVGFYSNYTYEREAGYFDVMAKFKWLLNTWSLSTEWQFYLLYPLILLIIARSVRMDPAKWKVLLWLLAGLSFGASVYYTPIENAAAFYLLHTRAWEMIAGGLVWLHAPRKNLPLQRARFLEVVGLGLIVAAVLSVTEGMDWPGWRAAIPVTGAALVIYGGSAVVLRARILQWIGTVSYSIYLWHWPVFVGLNYLEESGPLAGLAGIALSFILGGVSYHFVEKPTRTLGAHASPIKVLALYAICVLALGGLGSLAHSNKGYPARVSPAVLMADAGASDKVSGRRYARCRFQPKQNRLPLCVTGTSANPPVLLLGDSHALAVAPAVIKAAGEEGIHFHTYPCLTLFDAELTLPKGKTKDCHLFNKAAVERIKSLPENGRVIIANRFTYHLRGPNEGFPDSWGIDYLNLSEAEKAKSSDELFAQRLTGTLCALHAIRPVSVVLPIPEIGKDVPITLSRRKMLSENAPDMAISYAAYQERNQIVLHALRQVASTCGVELLDPAGYLCKDGITCRASINGRPLYYDDDHLNNLGAQKLVSMFEKALKQK